MSTLGERIKQARLRAKLSQAQLGAEFGVSREAVSHWESDTNAPTSDKLGQIASKTDVPSDWLISGRGEIDADLGRPNAVKVNGTAGDLRIQDLPQNLPILGAAACGEDGLFEFNGETLGHTRRPPRLLGIRDAYAVYVSGDSMHPWREPGDMVYVNPHQQPKIGDYVLVQLKPTDQTENRPAYIKRLVRRSPTSITVLQYNPRKELTIKQDKIDSIHRILDWAELMGF